ncbi:DUF4190 domain-containing protein [Cellulomonas sp. ICMP 17802]|uniref:DUF4190 domain-containing protein n=1 Tax=Cellulomonas sp. ICMP 17802 TaxID=3239199 RepID=UPI00351B9656
MSNEPGGPAPVPDPYAVPDPAAGPPVQPSGAEATPPVAPGAFEAPLPYAGSAVPPSASGPQPGTTPYGQPVAPYGAPQAGAPQFGAPEAGAPPYGAPPYGAPQAGAPQYGAPQYGAPQPAAYGTPQYGTPGYEQPTPYGAQPYGYGQPYGQPYVTPPTEGLAIASFVTSLVGMFLGGLPGVVGLGLGIAALRRIRVSGKAGRGWAIAGIVIGGIGILWMLAVIAYFVIVLAVFGATGGFSDVADEVGQSIDEGSGGTPGTDSGSTLPDFALRTDLTTGTCLTTFAMTYDMSDTDAVDCAEPHDAEVVGLIPMSGPVSLDADDEFDTAYNEAWDACDQLTEGLLPGYFSDGDISLYFPHPDDYAAGTTSAYCVYYGDEPGMTGSATAGTLQLAGAGTSS